ncbi:MAG: internal scaffolding protein [Microviridae sp.]|nr:MAG: internal scaffolding protein [Microviridae sp.]
MEVRHRYMGKIDAGRINFADQVSRTKQEFKDECDINMIMRRYQRSGIFPVGVGVGTYGDFSEVGDYLQAQETVSRAKAQFAGLPSTVRDRFRNDPRVFLDFVQNPGNRDECRRLGLLKEEEKVTDTHRIETPPKEPPKEQPKDEKK